MIASNPFPIEKAVKKTGEKKNKADVQIINVLLRHVLRQSYSKQACPMFKLHYDGSMLMLAERDEKLGKIVVLPS